MIELFQMLLSWQGILTLIVALYVIDDVFRLGLKPKVRKMVGRDDIFNKDPEIIALEQKLARLESNFQKLFTQHSSTQAPKRDWEPTPDQRYNWETRNPAPVTVRNETTGKTWQSWSDVEKRKKGGSEETI
jgi:hypothetical protein